MAPRPPRPLLLGAVTLVIASGATGSCGSKQAAGGEGGSGAGGYPCGTYFTDASGTGGCAAAALEHGSAWFCTEGGCLSLACANMHFGCDLVSVACSDPEGDCCYEVAPGTTCN